MILMVLVLIADATHRITGELAFRAAILVARIGYTFTPAGAEFLEELRRRFVLGSSAAGFGNLASDFLLILNFLAFAPSCFGDVFHFVVILLVGKSIFVFQHLSTDLDRIDVQRGTIIVPRTTRLVTGVADATIVDDAMATNPMGVDSRR